MNIIYRKIFLLGSILSTWSILGGLASTILRNSSENSEANVLCQLPDTRANSQVDVNAEWSHVGTVANYTCDPGFYFTSGQDHRLCQINGKWSGEAPSCSKMISFGRSASCTGETCLDPRQPTTNALLLLDGKDDSCIFLSPTDRQQTLQYRIDLMEHFRGINAFRFVFRGKSKDFSISRITYEGINNIAEELSPSNCIITQKDFEKDYREIQILPNQPLAARYVNVFVKIPTQGVRFCEAQVFSDKAPSIHDCFDTNHLDDSRKTRDILKATVTYESLCYSFDTDVNQWARANQQCRATNGGMLAHNITNDVNTLLINFAKANNMASMHWIGAHTDKRVAPGLKGDYAYEWQWITGGNVDKQLFNPTVIKENDCLGVNFPNGVWHDYPCHAITGSICQTGIKQCSSPERHVGVQIANVMRFSIGSVIQHSCAYGYILTGDEFRECLPNGIWSGEPPRCLHNGTLHYNEGLALNSGAIAGIIIAGVVIGILIIVLVITIVIFKRKGSFKKTIHFKKDKQSESVETLDNDDKKQHHEAFNQTQSQNYDAIPQQSQETQ